METLSPVEAMSDDEVLATFEASENPAPPGWYGRTRHDGAVG